MALVREIYCRKIIDSKSHRELHIKKDGETNMAVALVGGTVIDGNGGIPIVNGTVVVDGSKIVEVSQRRELGSEMPVFDVSGQTLMPGLIDCHTHLDGFVQWIIIHQSNSLMYEHARGIMNMRAHLETGCTSARDCGGLEVGLVQAQREGIIPGPRIQPSIMQISATNGTLDYMPGLGGAISPQGQVISIPGVPLGWADGVDDCRKKVREMLRYGAEVIKIFNSPHPTARPALDPWRTLFTDEELLAISDEAHKAGVQVTCHAYAPQAIKQAIRCGVDCIDHGIDMDDEVIEEMAAKGVWWVPTFLIQRWYATVNRDISFREMAKGIYERHRKNLPKAIRAGVRVAMGTDIGYLSAGAVPRELQEMVEAGISPMQAIEVSTRRAAECLGWDKKVGTLEVGKEADLLVVDGDPLADISLLQRLEKLSLVMQAGKPVAGPMAARFPWQNPGWPRPDLFAAPA